MSYHFSASLTAIIDCTDKDFELILDCCLHHYDSTVQSSVVVGGFLYGIKNRRNFSNGNDKTMELSLRQISLILKSFEIVNTSAVNTIGEHLYKVAKEMVDREFEINRGLNPTKATT